MNKFSPRFWLTSQSIWVCCGLIINCVCFFFFFLYVCGVNMFEREIALWLQVFLKTKFRIPLVDHHNKTFCVYSGAYFQPTPSKSWMVSLPHSYRSWLLRDKGGSQLWLFLIGRLCCSAAEGSVVVNGKG